MRNLSTILLLCAFCLTLKAQDTNYYTPAQYLAMQTPPVFKPNNHFPRLVVDGYSRPKDLQLLMVTNWDYCYTLQTIDAADYGSATTDLRYFATNTSIPVSLPTPVFHADWDHGWVDDAFYCSTNGMIIDSAGNLWTNVSANYSRRVVCPEAPNSEYVHLAAIIASQISAFVTNGVNVKMITTDGEYGLTEYGNSGTAWKKDPRVIAAMATNGLSWARYSSIKKAHQMGIISQAIRAAAPNRDLYVYYNTGGEQTKYHASSGYTYANPWTDYGPWGFASEYMNPVSDVPVFEDYFGNCPSLSYTNGLYSNHIQDFDLLSRDLDGVGFDYALGNHSLTYNYVNGGWSLTSATNLSPIPEYMGFLKCLYVAGMKGAVAGFYSNPTGTNASIFGENGFTGTFPTNIPPHWLSQIIALSRVHALFSWHEELLTNSILTPGNGVHWTSSDQPSYEYTNNLANIYIRTLARQAIGGDTNRWLICCWAPYTDETNVIVNIPALGAVNLIARPSGAVYLATLTALTLQDTNGLLPTEWMAESQNLAPPQELRILQTHLSVSTIY